MKHRHDEEDSSSIDLTPMVDVIFILLIFWLTVTHLTRSQPTPLDLPSTASSHTLDLPPGPLTVSILEDDRLWIADQETTLEGLIEALARTDMNRDCLIRARAGADFKVVRRLMTEFRRAGVTSVGVAVQSGEP